MEKNEKSAFNVLLSVDVGEHIEKKKTNSGTELSYLSWAWAWAEVKSRYPDTTYEIVKFDGLPYVFDEKTGYMVYTRVTIQGITHEMWLPVMDGQNRAMLDHPYKIITKYGKEIPVQAATMFDINKTIMRCLTKNLAVACGLGLSLYAGEDLPLTIDETPAEEKQQPKKATKKAKEQPAQQAEPPKEEISEEDHRARQNLVTLCNLNGITDLTGVCSRFGLTNESTAEQFNNAYNTLDAEFNGMMEV